MNILISGGAKNGKSYYAQKIAKQMAEGLLSKDGGENGLAAGGGDCAAAGGGDCAAAGGGDYPAAGGERCPAAGKRGVPLAGRRPLYYIATMIPHDEEDHARIRRHVAERAGWGFQTLERGTDLMGLLEEPGQTSGAESMKEVYVDPNGVFLLDSVTALLSNEMFRFSSEESPADANKDLSELSDTTKELSAKEPSAKDSNDNISSADPAAGFTPDLLAAERVAADCTAFAKATGNTVFVSDYIYGDAERYATMTEDYRRGLALVDRALAEVCDRVIEVSAGVIEEWK